MRVRALASGSSGNAYLVSSSETHLLVEAGLPASRLALLLTEAGIDPRTLSGILLTHAHSDHASGAADLSNRYSVPVYATAGTLGHQALRRCRLAVALASGGGIEVGDIAVKAFAVPHDCVEPVGYRLEGAKATVCVVTDLGFVPETVQPNLLGADLLVLEANHDEAMLWSGPYPAFLKRRVAGQQGHLSNREAARCVASLERRPPSTVWLAHLSLVNNREKSAVEVVRQALAEADLGHVEVRAARRNRPSLRWSIEPDARQLSLFDGR